MAECDVDSERQAGGVGHIKVRHEIATTVEIGSPSHTDLGRRSTSR